MLVIDALSPHLKDSAKLKKANDSLSTRIKTLEKDKEVNLPIQYINSIGSQWPFLLIVIVTVIFFLYRKKFDSFFSKTKSIKGGVAGATLEIVQAEMSTANDELQIAAMTTSSTQVQSEPIELIHENPIDNTPSIVDTYQLIKENKIDQAEAILKEVNLLITDKVEQEINKVLFQYYRYILGNSQSLDELINIKNTTIHDEVRVRANFFISSGYKFSQNYELSISTGLDTIRDAKTTDSSDMVFEMILTISEAFEKLNRSEELLKLIFANIDGPIPEHYKVKLYKKAADIFNDEKRYFESATLLLKASEHNTNDTDILFKMAYRLGEVELYEISLQYYELNSKLKGNQGATLNNLGVAYEKLGLKIQAVKNYKEAYDIGTSIAGSNLANKYLHVGFLEDARAVLDKIKIDSNEIDPAVWKAYSKLDEDLKEEEQKKTEIFKRSLIMKTFIEFYSLALINSYQNNGQFKFGSYKLKDGLKEVVYNEAAATIKIDYEDSDLTINFILKENGYGECTGLDNSKTGKPIKYDQYKGYFAFLGNELRVFLRYNHYILRQEIRTFEFIELPDSGEPQMDE